MPAARILRQVCAHSARAGSSEGKNIIIGGHSINTYGRDATNGSVSAVADLPARLNCQLQASRQQLSIVADKGDRAGQWPPVAALDQNPGDRGNRRSRLDDQTDTDRVELSFEIVPSAQRCIDDARI